MATVLSSLLEYSYTKDYSKSSLAYEEMLSIVPENYGLYSKLIKAYYANEDFLKGDSLFEIIKTKYLETKLPQDMQKLKGVTVDEFTWKSQRVSAMKYYKSPTEFAEPIYQFFLIDKEGKAVERKILTEKTVGDINGFKHLLCGIDKETGAHTTYPIGWTDDDIDYKSLKEYVLLILNDELKPQAGSNFSSKKEKRKKKKK